MTLGHVHIHAGNQAYNPVEHERAQEQNCHTRGRSAAGQFKPIPWHSSDESAKLTYH